jgi:polysaccharide export outer membrane protein
MKFSTLSAAITLVISLLLATISTAQTNYRIRAGDVLRIEVIEDSSLNRSVLVSPDGRITVPLAGAVQAAGRSVEAVQADLANQLAANFASTPSVFVSIERLVEVRPSIPGAPTPDPTIDVYVLGEADNTGKLEIDPETTVLQLFAQMGGFTNFAATSRIQLRRADSHGAETVYILDYDAIEAGLSPNGTSGLMDGDVIIVPQRRLFE